MHYRRHQSPPCQLRFFPTASLARCEDSLARHQRCATSCFMPFISNLNALHEVAWISLRDRASVMPLNRARTPIAYASHCDTFDGVVFGGDLDDLAAVACIVAETDNVWHGEIVLLRGQRIAASPWNCRCRWHVSVDYTAPPLPSARSLSGALS